MANLFSALHPREVDVSGREGTRSIDLMVEYSSSNLTNYQPCQKGDIIKALEVIP